MSRNFNEKSAKAFARCLDEDRFEDLQRVLEQDCIYDLGDETLVGPKAIAKSYESNMVAARQKLDDVVWGKIKVLMLEAHHAELNVTDHIQHEGQKHVHYCRQLFWINEQHLVERIQHVDLPGEPEKLKAFYDRVGL